MSKLISFSLWGDNPKYTIGAIENAKLAKIFYPGWKVRFYTSNLVSAETVDELRSQGSEVILTGESPDWRGMFWRFYAGCDQNYDLTIFRDADSRLNQRERLAVEEWEYSNKTFHIMRDHPCHQFPILGGMWGIRNKKFHGLRNLLDSFDKEDAYGTDYKFFAQSLYPLIGEDKIVHDEFFEGQPFPLERVGLQFVGEVFDENNKNTPEHTNLLKEALNV